MATIDTSAAYTTNLSNFSQYLGKTGTNLGANFKGSTALPDWAKNAFSIPQPLSQTVVNQLGLAGPSSFTFITAPQDISYNRKADVKIVSMFGTNAPPVTVGQVGMKKLTLSNALMEGFTVGKQVQKPIDELLNMMQVTLSKGFVNVPVYSVFANERSYSSTTGGWIIESVNVKEEIRDIKGYLTRAIVDVELQEVGAYQIDKGVDQANKIGAPSKGATSAVNQSSGQAAKVAKATASKTVPARR